MPAFHLQAVRSVLARLRGPRDCSWEAEKLFGSFLVLSVGCGVAALYGAQPPDPAVHWPGHKVRAPSPTNTMRLLRAHAHQPTVRTVPAPLTPTDRPHPDATSSGSTL